MFPLHKQFLPADAAISDAQQLRERASAIVWVRSEMAKHGISMDDLLAAGCFARLDDSTSSSKKDRALYRDADGHTWNGDGSLPSWLQRAVNAGQSTDHFRV